MYKGSSCGFLYGWQMYFAKSKWMSRNSTVFKLVFTVIDSPLFLNIFTSSFFLSFYFGPKHVFKYAQIIVSIKSHIFFCNDYLQLVQQVYANQFAHFFIVAAIATSKSSPSSSLIRGSPSLNYNIFLDCMMMQISSLDKLKISSPNSIALLNSDSEIYG